MQYKEILLLSTINLLHTARPAPGILQNVSFSQVVFQIRHIKHRKMSVVCENYKYTYF